MTDRLSLFYGLIILMLANAIPIIAGTKTDSIIQILNKVHDDTTRLRLLFNLSDQYYRTDADLDLKYNLQALELAEKISVSPDEASAKEGMRGIAKACNNLGINHKNKGDYKSSYRFYDRAISIYDKLRQNITDTAELKKIKTSMAGTLNNIGNINHEQGDFVKAFDYFLKSSLINAELNNASGIAACFVNIGLVCKSQKNYKDALLYYNKALKIFKKTGNKINIASCYNNIGAIYWLQKDPMKAVEYYFLCSDVMTEIGYKRGIAVSLHNIGAIYDEQGLHNKALGYYVKSLEIKEAIGDKKGITSSYRNIGHIYRKFADYDKAFNYFTKSLEIATEINAKNEIAETYLAFSEFFRDKNQYKKAYSNYVIYTQLKDSLFNEDKSKQIGRLEQKHEFEMVEIERKKVESEKVKVESEKRKRRNLLQYSAILISIILFFGLILLLVRLHLPTWVVELSVFMLFLLIFEFMLVLLDPTIEALTGGAPAYKLLLNAVLAGLIFPLHGLCERLLKKRVMGLRK